MLNFTICFIKRGNEILLLNREKGSWMGRWNGVGGKIEPGETPLQGVLREVKEETGLVLTDIDHKGNVTWVIDGADYGGMYVYIAEIPEQTSYPTPVKREEGILDWKTREWLIDKENTGLADFMYFLPQMLDGENKHTYRYYYEGDLLVNVDENPLEKVYSRV
ncbi:NUDIX hydrolase [Alteribacter keqinensis]|uniref:8-oxo-dGTP diphosphatase n=1 Tax=Alteribacter keqinensis TaxID=2483800 RepID=A0A3M7TX74_9BACI|nr:8-oxo-dGTP diphosphatase [Alteribacter keqinensis]RNA70176.1 8-oxo-dGTP diphosphatase [Alteribacter keqinensis]